MSRIVQGINVLCYVMFCLINPNKLFISSAHDIRVITVIVLVLSHDIKADFS